LSREVRKGPRFPLVLVLVLVLVIDRGKQIEHEDEDEDEDEDERLWALNLPDKFLRT
jgi:hypothetical protein